MEIKSNWQNGDSFDIVTDYGRIKSNINTVYEVSKKLYPSYDITTLGDYDYSYIPLANFFNDIVQSIQEIYNNSYKPSEYHSMNTYVGKGMGFSADDLNTLELNIYYLYCTMQGRINLWNKCGYETLGLKGGNF